MQNLKTYNKIIQYSERLHEEILSSGYVINFVGIVIDATTVTIFGDSFDDELSLDILITNHEIITLEEYKQLRYNEIDARTGKIISEGYIFDGNLFSLSTQAQNNWTNINVKKETFNALGMFPLKISTKDSNVYMLEYVDCDAFWGAGMIAVKTPYNEGGDLKKLIYDATTKAEIDLIIDNR